MHRFHSGSALAQLTSLSSLKEGQTQPKPGNQTAASETWEKIYVGRDLREVPSTSGLLQIGLYHSAVSELRLQSKVNYLMVSKIFENPLSHSFVSTTLA